MYMNISTVIFSFFTILFLNTKDTILTDKPLEFSLLGKMITIQDKMVENNTINDKKLASYTDEEDMFVVEISTQVFRNEKHIPFAEAFRTARKEKGPGKIFEWNGNYYTTNYYYEILVSVGEEVVTVDKINKTFQTSEFPSDILAIRAYLDNKETDASFEFMGVIRDNYACGGEDRYQIIE